MTEFDHGRTAAINKADMPAGRRAVLGGMAALGLAGVIGTNPALGQDAATPSATDENAVGSADEDEAAGGIYQRFVEALAGHLGEGDATTVDTAIRAALKSIVDEQLAAGDIAANDAEALKAQIDASEAPLKVRRFGKRGHGRGCPGNDQDRKPVDAATPKATEAG